MTKSKQQARLKRRKAKARQLNNPRVTRVYFMGKHLIG